MNLKLGDSRVRTDGFDRHMYLVNGIRTVVYSAGNGDPLVYFHGAGTFHGFDTLVDAEVSRRARAEQYCILREALGAESKSSGP